MLPPLFVWKNPIVSAGARQLCGGVLCRVNSYGKLHGNRRGHLYGKHVVTDMVSDMVSDMVGAYGKGYT